ncbi:MAG: hypothetical protein K8T91_06810 [Planctomycetes bacterium]|nr:hypothetical protein [Planctomycetota bacterium]
MGQHGLFDLLGALLQSFLLPLDLIGLPLQFFQSQRCESPLTGFAVDAILEVRISSLDGFDPLVDST